MQLYVQIYVSMEERALLQIIAAAHHNGRVSPVSNVSRYCTCLFNWIDI